MDIIKAYPPVSYDHHSSVHSSLSVVTILHASSPCIVSENTSQQCSRVHTADQCQYCVFVCKYSHSHLFVFISPDNIWHENTSSGLVEVCVVWSSYTDLILLQLIFGQDFCMIKILAQQQESNESVANACKNISILLCRQMNHLKILEWYCWNVPW